METKRSFMATVVGLLLLALCLLCAGTAGAVGGKTGRSARIEGVKPFPMDYDSGSMVLHALNSCLEVYGSKTAYDRLSGLSGAAFKFVYDSSDCYEPLRDIFPVDVLSRASSAFCFDTGHWVVNQPIDAVKRIIVSEIDQGRPLIAPYIKKDGYHGFFIITGYDLDSDLLYIQGAFWPAGEYVAVPIGSGWDGPTASPAGWATNPVFVIGEKSGEPTVTLRAGRASIEQAIRIIEGGEMVYGVTSGELPYMDRAGPHYARYGLPAFELLYDDVRGRPFVRPAGGGDELDSGFIWRIDTQMRQLVHDRRYAAMFSRYLRMELPVEIGSRSDEIGQNIGKTADDAQALRNIFWSEIPGDFATAADVAAYVESDSAMVFKIPERQGLAEDLASAGFRVFETPWGRVIVDDTDRKRLVARMLVKSLMTRERITLRLLRSVTEYLGERECGPVPGALK